MGIRKETEQKFLMKAMPDLPWDRSILVYQFFLKINPMSDEEIKVVFNLKDRAVRAYRISKQIIDAFTSEKETKFVDWKDLDFDGLVGLRYVLKKRYILEPYFYDHYMTPEIAGGVLEVEYNDGSDIDLNGMEVIRGVSREGAYQNRNMAVLFSADDLSKLLFLVTVFTD